MRKRKLTYKQVKSKQQKDLDSNIAKYYVYRHISSPFTWVFVNLGISPNAITISSFFLCLIGFYLLSQGSYLYLIWGLLFFVLFKIMDMSDGEVARIQNNLSIEGLYFDRVGHYIYSVCLGIGLGLGLYRIYQNDIYIIFGFIFTLVFVLENALHDLLRWLLKESNIKNKINSKKSFTKVKQSIDRNIEQKLMANIEGGSWENNNILSKLVGIYPLQGLIYSDTFTGPILIVLSAIEYALSSFIEIPVIFGYPAGIIVTYILIVNFSKTIWILGFIYKMEKNRYVSKFLNELK